MHFNTLTVVRNTPSSNPALAELHLDLIVCSSLRACQPLSRAAEPPPCSVRLQFHPGIGVGCGNDYTLYSLEQGVVVFEVIKRKKCVRPALAAYGTRIALPCCLLDAINSVMLAHMLDVLA